MLSRRSQAVEGIKHLLDLPNLMINILNMIDASKNYKFVKGKMRVVV
jgi:hypothetical protein